MRATTVRSGSVLFVVGLLLAVTLLPAGAAGRLTEAEQTALNEAIHEEYLALNTYQAVLAQFPGAQPFSNIAVAEQQHVNVVAGLFTKYGLTAPGNDGETAGSGWDNLKAACDTGVYVEEEDIALYVRILPAVRNKADITRVFNNLKSASLNNHLPAFEACN